MSLENQAIVTPFPLKIISNKAKILLVLKECGLKGVCLRVRWKQCTFLTDYVFHDIQMPLQSNAQVKDMTVMPRKLRTFELLYIAGAVKIKKDQSGKTSEHTSNICGSILFNLPSLLIHMFHEKIFLRSFWMSKIRRKSVLISFTPLLSSAKVRFSSSFQSFRVRRNFINTKF